MIRRVAEHEFIEQGWREGIAETGNQADSRTFKIRTKGRETACIRPQRNGLVLLPRVVDVAEREAHVIGEVVIHTDQLFPPVFWL